MSLLRWFGLAPYTTITISYNSEGAYFRVGDVLRNLATGEAIRVTSSGEGYRSCCVLIGHDGWSDWRWIG